MNYIYDILINFNEKPYDFYEWDINDEIIHIRKIPLFKIDSKGLYEIKNNKIKVDGEFLDKIRDKTEIFSEKTVQHIYYSFLLSDGNEVIGITLDNSGVSNKKSKLLLDEEEEVTEVCERIDNSYIQYQIIEYNQFDLFKTRNEIDMDKYIKKHIQGLITDNNLEKLRFLYYECFNNKEDQKEIILNKIDWELTNNWYKIAGKLYNFFKLTSINK